MKLLVVAPHPDDDALACGGTIARLHAGGARVRIVYVTDGSASHLGSRAFPPPRLARLRAREAHEAARALGIGTESLRFWRERDAALSGDVTAHARLVRRFARELDRFRPTVVLSPWIREPHADHAVCAHAVREGLARTRHAPILYEYPVWLGRFGDADAGAPRQSEAQCVRVDVAPYRARKRSDSRPPLATWRRRYGCFVRIRLAGGTDRSWRRRIRDVLRDRAGRVRRRVKPPRESLGRSYFDRLYETSPDPWAFATSDYEAQKYAATLNALDRPHYGAALEIGCSVGVFTSALAHRCDRLLAVDISPLALERARERNAGHAHVVFERMRVPQEFPPGSFDLIVLAEVAYYWSDGDFAAAADRIAAALPRAATLELVHYVPRVDEYVRDGDDVHEAYLRDGRFALRHETRRERYRIAVFRRT